MGQLVKFICDCVYDVDVEDIGWWREVSTDREGFLICVRHNQRRFGWRSLPEIFANRGNFSDYDYASYTPLQIERFLVFGEALPDRDFTFESGQDMRDNRDPEEVGRLVRVKRNGHSTIS